MLAQLRRIWLVAFLIVCGAAIASMLANESQLLQLPELRSLTFLINTVIVQILFWILASKLWVAIVAMVAKVDIGLWNSFRQSALVGLGKYLPGKVWGLVARGADLNRLGLDASSAANLTIHEQVVLLHSSVALSAILFAGVAPSTLSFGVLLAVLLTVWFGSSVLRLSLSLLTKFISRFADIGEADTDASLSRFDYIRLLAGYCIVWILSGSVVLCLYIAFFEVPVDPRLPFVLIVANAAAVSIGFFAVFAPGGIGVREAIAVVILSAFIPLATATTLVILLRLWTIGADVLAGIVVLLGQGRLKSN